LTSFAISDLIGAFNRTTNQPQHRKTYQDGIQSPVQDPLLPTNRMALDVLEDNDNIDLIFEEDVTLPTKRFETKKLAQKQIDFMRYEGDDGNEFKIVEIVELMICKDTSDFGEEWAVTRYNVIDLLDGSFSGRGESFSRLKDAISYCKSHKVGWERRKELDCED